MSLKDMFPSNSIVAGITGGLACFAMSAFYVGGYKEKIDSLEIESKKIGGIEKDVAVLQRFQDSTEKSLEKLIWKRNSPLSLTDYAKEILEEIGFEAIFKNMRDILVTKLEKYNPRTRYDVQEYAMIVLRKQKNNDYFIPLKRAIYEKGYNLEEVLKAMSIPLRDYYLEKHPEIID